MELAEEAHGAAARHGDLLRARVYLRERALCAHRRSRERRDKNKPTLPTRLDRELETNPFLRPHVTAIRAILGMPYAPDWKVFAAIRERKNKS